MTESAPSSDLPPFHANARFTRYGSPELEVRITRDLAIVRDLLCHELCHAGLAAIYLGGGYGRGEGGVTVTPAGEAPYNDYDLFIVVQGVSWVRGPWLRRRATWVADKASRELGVEVEVGVLRLESLSASPLTLMRVDFRHGARRIWGKIDALAVMPPLPPGLLPIREATYLLVNRGALLVMARQSLAGLCPPIAHLERYVRKAWLACGDATLIADGCYHPSWEERQRRVAAQALPATWKDAYMRALEERLKGRFDCPDVKPEDIDEVAQALRKALLLVEARRLGVDSLPWAAYERWGQASAGLNRSYARLVSWLARLLEDPMRIGESPAFLAEWRRVA